MPFARISSTACDYNAGIGLLQRRRFINPGNQAIFEWRAPFLSVHYATRGQARWNNMGSSLPFKQSLNTRWTRSHSAQVGSVGAMSTWTPESICASPQWGQSALISHFGRAGDGGRTGECVGVHIVLYQSSNALPVTSPPEVHPGERFGTLRAIRWLERRRGFARTRPGQLYRRPSRPVDLRSRSLPATGMVYTTGQRVQAVTLL